MKVAKIKKESKSQLRHQTLQAAMPEVRALCERHGRSVIASCVKRIGDYEKKSAEVERLRKEAAMLEQKLMTEDAAKAV